jgi:putative PIN family toxin of toxin-antitoxin system
MIRAVFDTNILFSATGWKGSPYHCLRLARERKITLILCNEILLEYEEKLQTKLGMTPEQASRAVAEILSHSTLVKINNDLHVVLDDSEDDKVIESAVIGKAAYIVSGDKHLLAMKEYQGIVMIKANEFLGLVAEDKENK